MCKRKKKRNNKKCKKERIRKNMAKRENKKKACIETADLVTVFLVVSIRAIQALLYMPLSAGLNLV